jgi:hypothetical protein
MENKTKANQRFFSVELKSKTDLQNLTVANSASEGVLIEGNLGEFLEASFEEGIILQVVGTEGTLRINIAESEIQKPKPASSAKDSAQQLTVGEVDM